MFREGVRSMRNANARAAAMEKPRRARIVAALESSAAVHADDIDVVVTDECVTLSGTVGTCAERREAERVVWASPGVRIVHDLIAIRTSRRR
jgi:osmotically-inducible protein OsmY